MEYMKRQEDAAMRAMACVGPYPRAIIRENVRESEDTRRMGRT